MSAVTGHEAYTPWKAYLGRWRINYGIFWIFSCVEIIGGHSNKFISGIYNIFEHYRIHCHFYRFRVQNWSSYLIIMELINLSRFSSKSSHSVKLAAVYYFITWLIHLSSCDIIRQYPRLGVKHELHYYFEHLSQVLDERNYSVTIPGTHPQSPLVVTTQVRRH